MAAVHQPSSAAVRLLAAWQQQRREVTDRLDSLLLHGPTAVGRVAARAQELREALQAEREAFDAFVDLATSSTAGTTSTSTSTSSTTGTTAPAQVAGPVPSARPATAPAERVYPRLRAVPSDVG